MIGQEIKPLESKLPKNYFKKYRKKGLSKILINSTCLNCTKSFKHSNWQKRRKYCCVRCSVLAQHGRKLSKPTFKKTNNSLSWVWFWDNTRIVEKNNIAYFYPKTSIFTWKDMHKILIKQRFYNKRSNRNEEYITLEEKMLSRANFGTNN